MMLKSTSILSIICGLMILGSCKNEPPPLTADEKEMIELAGADYKDNIRLPVDPLGNVDTSQMPRIAFENLVYDFGTITAGEKVNHRYTFKNTGVKDLIILDTQTTCGCTISKHTEDTVAPGSTGFVELSYDSKDRKGEQEKIVHVYTNTYPNETLLRIKGFVNSPSDKK